MTQKSITIKASLDARQAAYFVQTAGKFESEIQVSVDEKRINAKSIMGTIALNMQEGQTALITADGKDEAVAVEELAAVLAEFFIQSSNHYIQKPCRRINGRVDFFLHLCYTVKATERTRCTCYGYRRKGPREDHGYPTISVNKKQEVFF